MTVMLLAPLFSRGSTRRHLANFDHDQQPPVVILGENINIYKYVFKEKTYRRNSLLLR